MGNECNLPVDDGFAPGNHIPNGGLVHPNYHSRPYEFGGGILFSFQHEGRIRDAFVPPDLLSETGQTWAFREVLDYVERHPGPFIDAARRKAEHSKPPELLMLDRWVAGF